jgi:uncharacterized membrane protein
MKSCSRYRTTGPVARPVGPRGRDSAWALVSFALLGAAGCGEGPIEVLHVDPVDPIVPIVVQSAAPAQGEQGAMLEVTVTGSGFPDDPEVSWERSDLTHPQIAVQEVVFVSASELRATIGIDRDAELGTYDIVVTSRRKKGVGSEDEMGVGEDLFTVEPYEPRALGWLVESMWAGAMSGAYTINDLGVIAGYAVDASWVQTAIRWAPNQEPETFGGMSSIAWGSNNRGWIVGARGENEDYGWVTPFIFEDGVVIDLEPLKAPHRSQAYDVNAAGTIVGWGVSHQWQMYSWPVVWLRAHDGTYGAPLVLPMPGGENSTVDPDAYYWGKAVVVNDRGDVAGTLEYARGEGSHGGPVPSPALTYAALWKVRPDATYDEPILLAGPGSWASGMNEAGWIVGHADERPVLWHPSDYSTVIPLDFGKGTASAINDSGQIVGVSSNRGKLWTVDASGNITETIELLPVPGYPRVQVIAINADGWVVGRSVQTLPWRTMATLWRPED